MADWAKPFVGYAYANGLTAGTSATTFGGNDLISAAQYITFVLKVLGYEAGQDFQWDKAWELSDQIGLTDGRYHAEMTEFLRGDLARISYNSLSCEKHVNIFADIPEETAVQKRNFARLKEAWDWRYNFPADSRGLTLSWEQARALVGQDLDTVKRYVKTVEDCLYYICAADYTWTNGDLRQRDSVNREIEWHFNRSPQVVFERNQGNCGGTSGFVACLLEGDYDEVGFACYRSYVNDGGRLVNYLLDGDAYYVFD